MHFQTMTITTEQATVIQAVLNERERQDAKFGPQRRLNPGLWHLILSEEVGEVAEASLDIRHPDAGLTQFKHLRDELVQVAAVAIATIEDYDRQLRDTGRINQ